MVLYVQVEVTKLVYIYFLSTYAIYVCEATYEAYYFGNRLTPQHYSLSSCNEHVRCSVQVRAMQTLVLGTPKPILVLINLIVRFVRTVEE